MELQLLCEDGKQPGTGQRQFSIKHVMFRKMSSDGKRRSSVFGTSCEKKRKRDAGFRWDAEATANLPISPHPTICAEFAGRKSDTGCD
jgi:hypothetical protein